MYRLSPVTVANILSDGELDEESNLQKMQIAQGKPVTLHSLDMVISVGYRVSSTQGTLFRKWATEKLVQFATTGFVVDVNRLKDPDARDRFIELREIIRDIRSDERNVYRDCARFARCVRTTTRIHPLGGISINEPRQN